MGTLPGDRVNACSKDIRIRSTVGEPVKDGQDRMVRIDGCDNTCTQWSGSPRVGTEYPGKNEDFDNRAAGGAAVGSENAPIDANLQAIIERWGNCPMR